MARLWTDDYKPDIFIIQEAEITNEMNTKIKSQSGYTLYHTKPEPKSRLRHKVLLLNTEIKKVSTEKTDIFCCYRPFKVQKSPSDYINVMLEFVHNNIVNQKVIIVSDLNYDQQKVRELLNPLNKMLEKWNIFIDQLGATQWVTTQTWFRQHKAKLRSSILDICYSNFEIKCETCDLQIGDHLALLITPFPDVKAKKKEKNQNQTLVKI